MPSNCTAGRTATASPSVRASTGTTMPKCSTCGSCTTSSMRLTGAWGTSCACERSIQCASGLRSEARIQLVAQALVLGNAALARVETLGRRPVPAPRVPRPVPPRTSPARTGGCAISRVIGGVQDVGLREPRTVRGARRLSQRKESRERLDREVRHGLEHRDLDVTALAGAPALHQCAENALSGVQARDGIGQAPVRGIAGGGSPRRRSESRSAPAPPSRSSAGRRRGRLSRSR